MSRRRQLLTAANLTLRFVLELAAIGALGYWGFRTGSGPLAEAALGLGAQTVAMVVWGTFVGPKATVAVNVTLLHGFDVGSVPRGGPGELRLGKGAREPAARPDSTRLAP
jgi:hypothetical protein